MSRHPSRIEEEKMPAKQRGWTVRRGRTWAARYRDEEGIERLHGGFSSKTEARDWLEKKMDEIEALRSGDVGTLRRQDMPTLQELVDEYIAQHVAEENTLATLGARLRYATKTFGDVRLDRLAVRASRNGVPRSRRARPGTS
jgi:hypothetical protein